ncbi:MAG: transporter [Planctomycetota bacterium]|nr:transporter [Planctomycetota bacterium]
MKPLPFLLVALTPLLMLREVGLIDSQEPAPDEVLAAVTEDSEPSSRTNRPVKVNAPAPKHVAKQDSNAGLLDQPEADEAVEVIEPTIEEVQAVAEPQMLAQSEPGRAHHPRRRASQRLPGRTFAPIGVPLAQHVNTGQFALNLRASQNTFEGLRDSREDLSSADVFARGFAIAPTEGVDRLFEVEAMFGFDERLDLYFVVPYSTHNIDQDLTLGGTSDVESDGLGDIQIGGVFRSYDHGPTRVSYMAGISLPTGKVNESGEYDGMASTKLPYPLQLGSGTFDLLPGVLIESQRGDMQWGARASGRIHLQSAHDEAWFRSNSGRVDLWVGTEVGEDVRGTLRAQADWWGDLHGADPDLVQLRNPLEDPLRQGGSRVTLFGGLGKDLDKNGNNHLGIEVGFPVEEWLDGPALSQDWTAVIGWRLRF